MSQDYEPHNGFEKTATFYLEAAEAALVGGRPRLAVHLFRAAYEIELQEKPVVSGIVIDGLRKAWDIACEQGDRSTAELLYAELSGFNTPEQNEGAILRLQALALDQLGDIGVTESDIENIAHFISQEMEDSGNAQLHALLKSTLEQLGLVADGDEAATALEKRAPHEILPSSGRRSALQGGRASGLIDGRVIGQSMRERLGSNKEAHLSNHLDYGMLAGFDRALGFMRRYGFESAADAGYRSFITQSAAMHGVSTLALDETFLFYGPSREDTALFALATAGEIGSPLLHITVDLDEKRNGTIKLAGPFKRGFFGGPPDMMELASPCTVLIENIDYLEDLFATEQEVLRRNSDAHRGHPGRSMQAEITAYLRALSGKPDVFVMATAKRVPRLREPLGSILGPLQRIEVAAPFEDERHDILVTFAGEHPSFAELDVDEIARFSEGLSRHELIGAAHTAVEAAYRESLRTSRYHKVTIGEVIIQLASFIDHETLLYRQMEDEAVAQLYKDLEGDLF